MILLFEKVFTKGLVYQRKFCKEPVETVDIQLVISLCTLFESLFTVANGVKMDSAQVELSALLDKLFFFSYIWSVGASCNSAYWEAFNEHARELFEEQCPALGLPGMIIERNIIVVIIIGNDVCLFVFMSVFVLLLIYNLFLRKRV